MNRSDMTQMLNRCTDAQTPEASEAMLLLVYGELRKLAQQRLRNERAGHTLQATALVHEAYLRLVDTEHQQKWHSRKHFFAAAAEAMRRILIENARRKNTAKRGGEWVRTSMETLDLTAPESEVDLIELNEALCRLEAEDASAAMLVKLRYFSGLTVAQAADVLDVSVRAAERLWTFAKAWLYRELCDDLAS